MAVPEEKSGELSEHTKQLLKNFKPYNSFINPLLTDFYELTMVYSYFKQKKHEQHAVFDLFFRKCPFKGQYAVFCGLEDCLRFVSNFKFTDEDLEFLRGTNPGWTEDYYEYLRKLDCSEVEIHAQKEGTAVYPRVPMLRVEGPLGVCQLLETTLLNCVNYASLIATNAARHRVAVGDQILLEFGLRRAQGPDGGISASRFSYIGGYSGTSNVLAGKLFGIPVKGTHAHSYVSSFKSFSEIHNPTLKYKDKDETVNFVERVHTWRKKLEGGDNTNTGELTAFTAYALNYPNGFLALIDTYNTNTSGMINFAVVALALLEMGYRPVGVRIDSGHLVQQSIDIKQYFVEISQKFNVPVLANVGILASNDIDESMLHTLHKESEVTGYGVGTRLVTCKNQPALGGVYKLVQVNSDPRIKISQEKVKVSIPGKKNAYRIYNSKGFPMCDILALDNESAPEETKPVLCRDFFEATRRVMVESTRVERLLDPVWKGNRVVCNLPTIHKLRQRCIDSLNLIGDDQKRMNAPTEYKVLLTEPLYHNLHKLIMQEVPVERLSG